MKEWPKVSVIISTYNRPEMLDKALASVHAQTFDDFEVIVVDDCSPDQEAFKTVGKKWYDAFEARGIDSYWCGLKENSGYQCAPKNMGIALAKGDYLAYLDDDNQWRPNHLAVLVAAIEADFSHDMVYSRRCCHTDEETLKKIGDPNLAADMDIPGTPWNPGLLQIQNFVDTSEMLVSRGAHYRMVRWQETNGVNAGWDEEARRFGDWLYMASWATAGNNGKLVDEVTVDYYLHAGSMQVTRPSIEVPVCGSYANYRTSREQRDPTLRLPS